MASNKKVDVDPKALENAETMWGNFMVATKYSIIATALLLIALALAFVKF